MSKYISELSNAKHAVSYDDWFIADSPADNKTYKVKGSAFRPNKISFTNSNTWLLNSVQPNAIIQTFNELGEQIEGEIKKIDEETINIFFNKKISGFVLVY